MLRAPVKSCVIKVMSEPRSACAGSRAGASGNKPLWDAACLGMLLDISVIGHPGGPSGERPVEHYLAGLRLAEVSGDPLRSTTEHRAADSLNQLDVVRVVDAVNVWSQDILNHPSSGHG
jgi:hypothetical protein